MHVLPALVGALVGLLGGLLVPRLVALCPEPAHNPAENPAEFPDHVPFAELAARPGLALRSALAGAVAGGVLGAATGWAWGLPWLLFLVPVGIALAVIDYVTWYLPSRLIWPSYAVVLALEVVATIALEEPGVLLLGAIGFAGLGAYYGLLWFISPRMMAFGDVRLGALLGLALGPFGLGTVLVSVVAAALLAVLAMVPMRRGGTMIRRKVPYGPFLVGGALVAVVLGQVLAG
jgi:leader peptidase (prepilin peptidase)/N-methyltransferase